MVEIEPQDRKDKIKVECDLCGSLRIGKLTFDNSYPFDKEVRKRKLKRKEKLWYKRQRNLYIQSLKKGRKGVKANNRNSDNIPNRRRSSNRRTRRSM
jgi:hypothetical protein